jgi:dimethylsulfone monooxygenase
MSSRVSREDARLEKYAGRNPLFNDRKLKLGSFGSNVEGGCAVTSGEGILRGDWSSVIEVAKLADEMGLDAIVPLGRYRGFGGETDYGSTSFEVYTWAAAVAAQTSYSAVFATSHVPTMTPVMAAKPSATVDHISGGRFVLNLVTGWHDVAAEWLEIIKLLWELDEPINYEGRFCRAKDALLRPRPVQQPRPPVMCAGQSPKGMHFAAKYCDIGFIAFEKTGNLELMRTQVENFKNIAWKEYGRTLKVWSLAYVIQGDTEKEARRLYDYYVRQTGDFVAAKNVLVTNMAHAQTWSEDAIRERLEDVIAGFGSYPLIGTPEQIAAGLQMLSDTGLEGVVLSWPGYRSGLVQFGEKVLPLLEQAGLR